MQRSYRYRFYPTPEQESLLRRTIGCCRFVYNRALALHTDRWRKNKSRLSGYALQKEVALWKRAEETAWLRDVSSVPLQQSVSDLEASFHNFFAKRSGYPVFKKKDSGGSCRFTAFGFRIKKDGVWLAKTEAPLNIVWSRPLPEKASPSQCTVRLTPTGGWYIIFLCNIEVEALPPTDKHVGLDMGLTALVTTSDGEKVTNPRTFKTYKRKLANAQRNLSRKTIGSANRNKAKRKVAIIYQKISNIRKDHLHKLTTRLVRENQSIAIEDLAIQNMLKCRPLAGSISDSGWGFIKQQLEYKCRWYGRELRVVDRWFPSSKTCHECGHVVPKLPLNIRQWDCPKCSASHDRDVNAAKNILAAGGVVNACGGAVNPKR